MDFEKYLHIKDSLGDVKDVNTDSSGLSFEERKKIEFYDQAMRFYRKSVPDSVPEIKLRKPKGSLLSFGKTTSISLLALAAMALFGFFFVFIQPAAQSSWQVSKVGSEAPSLKKSTVSALKNSQNSLYFESKKYVSAYLKKGSELKIIASDTLQLETGELILHKVPQSRPFYLNVGTNLRIEVTGTTFKTTISDTLVSIELFKGEINIKQNFENAQNFSEKDYNIKGYALLTYRLGENGWIRSLSHKANKASVEAMRVWEENNFKYSAPFYKKVLKETEHPDVESLENSGNIKFKHSILLKNGVKIRCNILKFDTKYYYIQTASGEEKILKSQIRSTQF